MIGSIGISVDSGDLNQFEMHSRYAIDADCDIKKYIETLSVSLVHNWKESLSALVKNSGNDLQ